MGFHDSAPNFFFQNTKISDISPQIIHFKNLDDSVVIFQALQTSAASLTSVASATGLNSLYSHISSKNFLILMVWSSITPKLPIVVIFCEMDHQKPNFALIYGTLSGGGCWGQLMLLFQKLVDETQMLEPQEYTDTFILTKNLFLVGLLGLQNISNPVERPCISLQNIWWKNDSTKMSMQI